MNPALQNPIRALDVIQKKREGYELSQAEITYFVNGYTHGEIPDYQAAAWLMATTLRGLTRAETAALTEVMLHSGEVLDLSEFAAKKVDKHSTGGVGDKTSLVLAPVVAAAGLIVPMISGRGLGHTGGTLDKLESIPGFNVNLSVDELHQVLHKAGCAIVGATAGIVPADRKLYALRDVTSTVESPFLICASIMSKKLAEGIDGLVLDVKTGSGAFMKEEADAILLAELMVETGEQMGKKIVAVISNMDQPLGNAVGNALEVKEALDALKGVGPNDLRELCLELASQMFCIGGFSAGSREGRQLATEMITNGRALTTFRQMVAAQGGDVEAIDHPERLPQASHSTEVLSPKSGYIRAIQCNLLGNACVMLGGGRERKEDSVDPAVGLIVHKKVGGSVLAGEPLCRILYNSETRLPEVRRIIESSYTIVETETQPGPLVRRTICGSRIRSN